MEFAKKKEGKDCKIFINGRFTFMDHPSFKSIISTVQEEEIENIILDLSETEFIDSAALGMILILNEESERRNVNFILRNPVGQVKKMFELSKFYQMLNIQD